MIAQHIYLMKDEILNPDDNNQVLDTFNVYDVRLKIITGN